MSGGVEIELLNLFSFFVLCNTANGGNGSCTFLDVVLNLAKARGENRGDEGLAHPAKSLGTSPVIQQILRVAIARTYPSIR